MPIKMRRKPKPIKPIRRKKKKPVRRAKKYLRIPPATGATLLSSPRVDLDDFGEVSRVNSFLFYEPPYPYNPDDLVGKKGLRIYTDMQKDEQIKAALLARQFAVLASGWEIIAADQDTDAEKNLAQEHADFVKFNFDEMAGSFDNKLLEMQSAHSYGFAVAEKIYWMINFGQFDGKFGLKDLKFRNPDGIDFQTDTYGNLTPDGVLQAQRSLPAKKFLIYTYRKYFSNYYGSSDLRDCHRAWWCKENFMKFMAIALERYGEPTWIFTIQGTSTRANRNMLQSFMQDLQTKSGLILPSTITADPKYPAPRAGEAFIPVLEHLNGLIRMALLMPGLMGFSGGESEKGSFARSKTEADSFLQIIGYLRGDLEVNINEQLVKPLMDLNYEIVDGKYPAFKFKAITEEHRIQMFEKYIEGLNAKAITKTRDDENRIREVIDFPPLDEETPVAGTLEAAEAAGLPVAGSPPFGKIGEQPDDDDDDKEEFSYAGAQRKRTKLTVYEKRVDFAQAKVFLEISESGAREELSNALKPVAQALTSTIERLLPNLTPESILQIEVPIPFEVRNAVKQMLIDIWKGGVAAGKLELPASKLNATKLSEIDSGAIPIKASNPFPGRIYQAGFIPVEALRAFETRSWLISGIIGDDLRQDVRFELFEHLKGGRTIRETMDNLRKLLAPWIGDPTKIIPSGVTGTAGEILQAHRLENIIRTESIWSYNQGRLAIGDAAEDYVTGYQLSAILDERTTLICQTADGKLLRDTDPRLPKLTPPLHWQCRTILVYVTTDDGPVKWSSEAQLDRVLRLIPAGFK